MLTVAAGIKESCTWKRHIKRSSVSSASGGVDLFICAGASIGIKLKEEESHEKTIKQFNMFIKKTILLLLKLPYIFQFFCKPLFTLSIIPSCLVNSNECDVPLCMSICFLSSDIKC